MKYVETIIRPNKYIETKEKLAEKGFYSAIVMDVIGRGKGEGKYKLVNGEEEYTTSMSYKAKKYIGMYLVDEDVEKVIDILLSVNSTGSRGDGKIFVFDLDNAVRISTGIQGEDAIV